MAGTDSTTAEPNAGKDTPNTYSGPTCSSTCCGAAVAKRPPHTRQTTPSRLPYSSLVQLFQTANATPYKTKSHIHHTERQALAADSTGHLHTHACTVVTGTISTTTDNSQERERAPSHGCAGGCSCLKDKCDKRPGTHKKHASVCHASTQHDVKRMHGSHMLTFAAQMPQACLLTNTAVAADASRHRHSSQQQDATAGSMCDPQPARVDCDLQLLAHAPGCRHCLAHQMATFLDQCVA